MWPMDFNENGPVYVVRRLPVARLPPDPTLMASEDDGEVGANASSP